MEFKKKILQNGLSIIGEVNKSAKSAAVGFFVKTGSRDETKQINGVSHFLEHMLFKGTEKLSAFEVNEAFDKTGAQFNAETSAENTVFYAAVLPEYLNEVTSLWIELMRPSLRNEDFNIEKNVIKEEIAMYKDSPTFDVMDKCRSLHFDGHPCGNSVLGTEESIDNLTAEQMRSYFTNRYAPNNLVLACAGNFNWDQICSTAENGCGKWQKQTVERKLEHCRGSRKEKRAEKANLAREHICLMSAGVPAQDKRRFAASLLGVIIGDDVGSRFFWELVNKALAEVAAMQFGPMDGTGAFYSYVQCAVERSPQVMEIVERVFREVGMKGIRDDELTGAKNKLLSSMVLRNELPMGRLGDLGSNWFYLGDYRSVEDDVKAVKAVTIDHVNALAREINLSSYTKYSLGPESTE